MSDLAGTPAVRRRAREAWRLHAGRDVDPDALGAGSLPDAFHQTATAAPARPAIEIDGRAATHGELDELAARLGGRLRERGVEPGDAVLLAGHSSLDLVAAYLGALRAGATVVLANPTLTASELRHVAEDSGAAAALAATPAGGLLASIAADVPALREVVDLEVLAGEVRDAPALPPDPGAADGPALLSYTSGTTGTPKAVPLTHASLLASIRAAMLAWRWAHEDVLVHSLPLFHQHGLGGIHATLLAGSRAVIHRLFDPAAVCSAIASARATVLFAVPAIYERLVGWEGIEAAELGSLRLLVSGSAPLSPALAERVAQLTGQLPLDRYGTTESGLDVSNPYEGARRPGTVGLPLPGVELAITDEDGRPVGDGEDGEIVVRGPQVFSGYRGDAAATASAFHPGGWFRTGDLGRLDPADGYLEITGRAKELIISGGMNVYPHEVQLALEASDAVARAAVVGVPSERWGEEVVAAVVPASGETLDADALLTFVADRLAPYKRPKRVVVVHDLPVNDMGKVLRSDVVSLVSRGGTPA